MSSSSLLDYSSVCNGYKEPNIVKAQFILSNTRIYTLEFDQNITMFELKIMIQKAAHLRSRNFRLFSNAEEYTQFNDETFESLFHGQKLVVFNVEVQIEELYDGNEYLLQMNCPCNTHIDKFLIYYCFTCRESICSDCFTIGTHRGHQIQEKCFYLLPSKFLVDKLFENWSQNPNEDFKYIEDQTLCELRTNINKIVFDKLFLILKDIQKKVTNVIEQYHQLNFQSFNRMKYSVRDIKIYCIKLLDDLKEKMNIKDILNNDQIFLDFDKAYKKLGKLQNERYKLNIVTYNEFIKQIPSLVINAVNDINEKLLLNLNQIANDQRYENIINQIQINSIQEFNIDEIEREIKSHIKKTYNDYPKKKFSFNYIDNNFENKFIQKFEKIHIDNHLGRKTIGADSLFSNNLQKNGRYGLKQKFNHKNLFHLENIIKQNATNIISNSEKKKYHNINNNNNNLYNDINNKTIDLIKNDNNNININNNNQKMITTTTTTTIKKEIVGMPSLNIATGNIQSNISLKPQINNNLFNKTSSFSAQNEREVMHMNKQLIYSEMNNNRPKLNINNTLNDSYSSNSTLKNINQIAEENIKNINNEIIKKTTISSYTNTTKPININNNKIFSFNANYNTIPEELVSESDNELSIYAKIKTLISKKFILAPISQTNAVKIITPEKDESIIKLVFPNKITINSFLLENAYCNLNKELYITGGLKENEKTNITLSVNLTRAEQINQLAPMNFARCSHSMISYGDIYLLVVGGLNSSSVERYNIIDNIWEVLHPMNYKRMYPILAIYNDYLYSFFGKSNNNEYCNTIERISLNGIKFSEWEMIQFSNPNNIDTRIYGCATHIIGNHLYLFGGKYNEVTTDKIIYYIFEKNILENEESTISEELYFKESKLYEMDGELIQIAADKYSGIYMEFK